MNTHTNTDTTVYNGEKNNQIQYKPLFGNNVVPKFARLLHTVGASVLLTNYSFITN